MQEELDAVCGSSLPNFSQRASLPYSEAVLMEIQRISSIAPLTVPHVAMKETQLQGYTIPEVVSESLLTKKFLVFFLQWTLFLFFCATRGAPC